MSRSMLDGLQEAISKAGGQSALAKLLRDQQGEGATKPQQGHVWSWLNESGRVPAEWVIPIERATGVPRSKIRPDLYPPEGDEAAA